MKTCVNCKIKKQENEYSPGRNDCRICRNKLKQARPKKKYEVTLVEKICSKCNILKPSMAFNADTSRIGGLHTYCNDCRSNHNKNNYVEKSEIKKKQAANYYLKVRKTEEYRKKAIERQKNKERSNIYYKLSRRLRNRLYHALRSKNWSKNNHFVQYIGCDQQTLIKHLETQFKDGMSWLNYGDWHIDHIIPLSSATSEQHIYSLCHYTNLQPLWAIDNIIKGSN
jgi:hypothetical protein